MFGSFGVGDEGGPPPGVKGDISSSESAQEGGANGGVEGMII